MSMMKDSTISDAWIAEQLRVNPACVLPKGNLFSGPVRLAYANIFKPGKTNNGAEGKFGAALLFPVGANLSVFEQAWMKAAREGFPRNWDDKGNPVGLHIPFHRQEEKAFGPKPSAGYTPGAVTFNVSSKFAPPVVDANMNPITDESRVYSGVWAFVSMNCYKYGPPRPKSGISFGIQTVMLIADDAKLSGGGGNPQTDFAGVTITATANVADKFAAQQFGGGTAGQGGGLLSGGGHMGVAGSLPITPIGASADDL